VIVIGTNPLAVDVCCSHILGFKPEEIGYLRSAQDRGYGPVSVEDIELLGDTAIDELREKTKGERAAIDFYDLSKIATSLRFYVGNYSGGDGPCDWGCMLALRGALAIFDGFRKGSLTKTKPTSIVVGEYERDIDADRGLVIYVGDCTKVKGRVKGKVRTLKGCPVPAKDLVNTLVLFAGLPNIYWDKLILTVIQGMTSGFLRKAVNRGFARLF
jgi:hypothetical protein